MDTLDGSGPAAAGIRLDSGDRRVLASLATGLTAAEAADHLGLDADEVHLRLRRSMRALGARSKLQAVVAALGLRLITLDEG